MPGLIGSQGVRPGAMNMNRIFRALRYRTEQAQYVTYHRPPIYGKDNYGVETGVVSGSELLMPDLPAIIRPTLTADYQIQEGGGNIIGAARVYTPNLATIKNLPNFDQDTNTSFNEIEGWDRLIAKNRSIYAVPTSGTTGWIKNGSGVISSDGESVKLTVNGDSTFIWTGNVNTLEADRLKFKIRGSGSVQLNAFRTYNGGDKDSSKYLDYDNANFVPIDGTWLTVDVPFTTGSLSDGTSIYQTGSRYAVTTTTGSGFDVEANTQGFQLTFSADTSDTLEVKEIEYYKSISWHVHSLKDMTDGYIIFNCVRTKGRRDSLRRAYG
jgi:hypothetical protein